MCCICICCCWLNVLHVVNADWSTDCICCMLILATCSWPISANWCLNVVSYKFNGTLWFFGQLCGKMFGPFICLSVCRVPYHLPNHHSFGPSQLRHWPCLPFESQLMIMAWHLSGRREMRSKWFSFFRFFSFLALIELLPLFWASLPDRCFWASVGYNNFRAWYFELIIKCSPPWLTDWMTDNPSKVVDLVLFTAWSKPTC